MMKLEDIPPAVEYLYAAILAFQPVTTAIAELLADYDVTEPAVRARFESHYRRTPEEVAQRNITDGTLVGYLERARQAKSSFDHSRTEFLGKRFCLDLKRDGRKRWFRFLVAHGYAIGCIDESNHREVEITDSDVIDDIARQIGWKRWSHWPEVSP